MCVCMCGMGKNGLVLVLARRGGSSVKERGMGRKTDGMGWGIIGRAGLFTFSLVEMVV